MEKREFSQLMDEIIQRKLLPGNTAQEPKKEVRIMVCADFEDSDLAQDKFFHFTPKPLEELPPFRLCHPKYWEEGIQSQSLFEDGKIEEPQSTQIHRVRNKLGKVFK